MDPTPTPMSCHVDMGTSSKMGDPCNIAVDVIPSSDPMYISVSSGASSPPKKESNWQGLHRGHITKLDPSHFLAD